MFQLRTILFAAFLASTATLSWADDFDDTIKVFKGAGQSAKLFGSSYGYAVFPTIGKGGIGIGGAHGSGRVYQKGAYVGDTSMTQLTVGLQFGGQAYSQIIFFQNKASFDNFTSGNFEFGAQATAVAIKSSAGAQAGTTGTSSGASSSGKADSCASGAQSKTAARPSNESQPLAAKRREMLGPRVPYERAAWLMVVHSSKRRCETKQRYSVRKIPSSASRA